MAIQIQEQHCPTQGITAQVKFSTQLVVNLGLIGLRNKEFPRVLHILIGTGLHDVVEVNQIAVNVGKDITRKVGIEKYRPGTYKRLNQALALRQVLLD